MSVALYQKIPDAEVLLSLEPEELGFEILKILIKQGGQHLLHNFNNEHNQMQETYPKNRVMEVQKAISEAWSWLELERLIAEQPGSSNHGWKFVTRRGVRLQIM